MTRGSVKRAARSVRWQWAALIILLIVIRLPSLVQPSGGDQSLYAYAGQRILAGDVMYRDMWDQKPPAIEFIYAGLGLVWRDESMVPGADLLTAAGIACLLVVLGKRRYSTDIGCAAAAIFLLFGDPYVQRLSGIYVRGQCEPFIGLSLAASLVLLAHPTRRRAHLVGAGIALAVAFWLKYSVAYALPIAAAAWAWRAEPRATVRDTAGDLAWIGVGFGLVAAAALAYFAANGALPDLRLATVDYNLRYSNETYESPAGVLRYLFALPVERARVDMLWFLGGIGALLLAWRARANRSAVVALGWLAAAILSIAINGRRDLPNYFVQAAPALGLVSAAGLATLGSTPKWTRYAVVALLAAGLWRVGPDKPVLGLRLASMPGLVHNVRYDLDYMRGRIDRDAYLARFRGQKHDALEIARLVDYVSSTTTASDPIYVFGFSGGAVCWKADRVSSSRFFWSRPILIEFAAGRPGYGSAGLLEDLRQRPPLVVALQKEEWHSRDFFMTNAALHDWLVTGYTLDHETEMFSVWRRKS